MTKEVKVIHSADLDLSADQSGLHWSAFWLNLSIQQKLPFYIFILMAIVVGTFSWISYLAVRKAGMSAGADRVTALADKLSVMFKESVDRFAASAKELSQEEHIHQFVASPQNAARASAISSLQAYLQKDTTNKAVELLNAGKHELLHAGDPALRVKPDALLNALSAGRIVYRHAQMYFPVIVQISDSGKKIGYLVNWKHLYASRESIEQFGQLIGSGGSLYFGNDDGSLWTDLDKPVPGPPIDLGNLRKVAEYERGDGSDRLGSVRNVPGSHWDVLVELSGASFLETSHTFLRWVVVAGLFLVAAGSLGGWLLSRSITRPLTELDNAASEISGGNYAVQVPIQTRDELGRLAASFNTMTRQVRAAQQGLKQQVQETSKELETAIIDIQQQKEIDKKKDEFISLASHELKTPLTTIKAFFQLAIRDIPSESGSFRLIPKASRQVNRMERLIGDLLDVSRINAGQLKYNPEEFDFGVLLEETTANMRHVYPGRSLVLEKSAPVRITADRQRIGQVIINLVNNAVKYSPAGGQILIRSAIGDGRLLVTIEDFGIGIEENDMDKLFERFNRIETDHRFQGMGLGLFISAEIIKHHGGSIFAESNPGKGSAFTFELPLTNDATV
ncbi:MAG: HAMP domain-containing sensor histidine kinase [Mucilaginibacter sp.]